MSNPAKATHGGNRRATRSASRGTGQGLSSPNQTHSQPIPPLRNHPHQQNPPLPIMSQLSPRVPARKSKRITHQTLHCTQVIQPILVSPHVEIPHPCGMCAEDSENDWAICCEGECGLWYHIECIGMDHETFQNCYVNANDATWFCFKCRKIKPNIPSPHSIPVAQRANMMWGKYPLGEFEKNIQICYKQIVKWRKNLFLLPSGRVGKDFLQEVKKLIDSFTNKTPYYTIALNAVMVMIPMLLQKPAKNSKTSDHI